MPMLHGNMYAAVSISMTAPRSDSVMRRWPIFGGGNCSRAAATGHLHREPQVVPGFALLAGRAQQVRRVVGHDDRDAEGRELVRPAAQLADRRLGREQVLRGDPP